MSSRRFPTIAVLVALLVGALLTDRETTEVDGDDFGRDAPFVMPVAAPAGALTSTWFCPAATATGEGGAEGFVVVANAAAEDRTGTVTVFPAGGEPVRRDVVVAPLSRIMVRLSDVVKADYAAALVEFAGGDVAVEVLAVAERGSEASACSTDASDEWYLAHGVTTRDAREIVTLFNPFPEDAIVDLTFATNEGPFAPRPLQALVVPAGRVVAVDLNEQVRRRTDVAMTLRARTGRLVVGRIQTFDGSAGNIGMVHGLAMPAAAEEWMFATGLKTEGLRERFHVYNPADREAEVDLTLSLTEGFAEPFELTIPPESYVTVDVSGEERVPAGFHSATVQSLNGVPVVAERSFSSPEGERRGYTVAPGAPLAATRWVLSAGEATEDVEQNVVVYNRGPDEVEVSVRVLAKGQALAVAELADVPVPPGGFVGIRPFPHVQRKDLPLLIEATGPVVVERILVNISTLGYSVNPGIPLR